MNVELTGMVGSLARDFSKNSLHSVKCLLESIASPRTAKP